MSDSLDNQHFIRVRTEKEKCLKFYKIYQNDCNISLSIVFKMVNGTGSWSRNDCKSI